MTLPIYKNRNRIRRKTVAFFKVKTHTCLINLYLSHSYILIVPQIFVLRKRSSHTIRQPGLRYYICSLSLKTVVYKGQLTADQLWSYFTDLKVSLCYFYVIFFVRRHDSDKFGDSKYFLVLCNETQNKKFHSFLFLNYEHYDLYRKYVFS